MLLEAAGAAHLPVRAQLRGHGVGDHASQDVVLRGHHVLDQKVGSVVDVEVVLRARHFSYGREGERGGRFGASASGSLTASKCGFAFSYSIAPASASQPFTFRMWSLDAT